VKVKTFDPQHTYLSLSSKGDAIKTVGGEAFWKLAESQRETYGQDWLMSEYNCYGDWGNWEMHPEGDELVYALHGKAVMILEVGGLEQKLLVEGGSAVVIPKGVWHTANVKGVARMLHITMGKGTEHRPREKASKTENHP
jgi:mannose-6-phosphate isomerase-like protein (cupin superfamily)